MSYIWTKHIVLANRRSCIQCSKFCKSICRYILCVHINCASNVNGAAGALNIQAIYSGSTVKPLHMALSAGLAYVL